MENKLLLEHKVDLVILNLKTSQCPHILYTVNYPLSMKSPADLSSFASCHFSVVCSSSCLSYLTTLCYFTPLSPYFAGKFPISTWWNIICPVKAKLHGLHALFPPFLHSLLIPPVPLCNLLNIGLSMKLCNYLKSPSNPAIGWRYFEGIVYMLFLNDCVLCGINKWLTIGSHVN